MELPGSLNRINATAFTVCRPEKTPGVGMHCGWTGSFFLDFWFLCVKTKEHINLVTAIEKEDVLPNAMIRDIMVANPHTAKSNELIDKLDERWDPLPEYMKAQILQGKSIVSIREETESELAAFKQEKAKVFNKLVRYYLNDTINTGASFDSLVELLNSEHSLAANYSLAFVHVNNGELQQGLNVIDDIPSQFQLDDQQTAEYQQIEIFYDLVHDLMLEEKSILEVDSLQLEVLANLEASATGIASVFARNILLALDEIEYDEPILLPDIFKSSEAFEEYLDLLETEPPKLLKVKPIPANDYIIVEYSLDKIENTVIEIVDINGKPVVNYNIYQEKNQEVIDTGDWKPGIYLAIIKANDNVLESVKFTVIK